MVLMFSGHGIVLQDPVEVITYYIKHRHEREKQIIAVLVNSTADCMTTLEIVKIVYQVCFSKSSVLIIVI